jgi:hypothetical protein
MDGMTSNKIGKPSDQGELDKEVGDRHSPQPFLQSQFPTLGYQRPLLELFIRTEHVAKFCLGCSHKELLAWLDRYPAEFPPYIRRVYVRKGKNRGKYPRIRYLFPSEVIGILTKLFNPLYAKAGELPFPPSCPWCWGSGLDIRQATRMKQELRNYKGFKKGTVALTGSPELPVGGDERRD